MVISGTKRASAQILMIQAEGMLIDAQSVNLKGALKLEDSKIERIAGIYRDMEESTSISTLVDIDMLAYNDWVLLPSRYVRNEVVESEYGSLIVKAPIGSNWIPLGSAGSFFRGMNVAPAAVVDDGGEYRIINLVDVQKGEIQLDSLTRYKIEQNVNVRRYSVLPGDVLVSCKGSAIKTCVVPPHSEPILLSINFIGIRVDSGKFDPYYIKYYLESPAAQAYMRSKQVGTSIITLSTRDLEEIPIPVIPLEAQHHFVQELANIEDEIQQETQRLYTWSKQARWSFYQNIGLGEIMWKGDVEDDD
jgi:type I restriction enzyme M protein